MPTAINRAPKHRQPIRGLPTPSSNWRPKSCFITRRDKTTSPSMYFGSGTPTARGNERGPVRVCFPHWIDALHNDTPIRVFGDGSAQRDYLYIEDVCRLMSISCQRLDSSKTFNLGTGEPTSLKQLLAILQDIVPCPATVEYLPGRASDIASISLCSERLLSLVPDFEFTPLEEGLRRTLAHHRLIPS